jgi:hypothetical protein
MKKTRFGGFFVARRRRTPGRTGEKKPAWRAS